MIETILRGSLIGRMLAYLQKIYHKGVFAAFFVALQTAYEFSLLRKCVQRFVSAPSWTELCGYTRLLNAINQKLHNIGTLFERASKYSRFMGFVRHLTQRPSVSQSAVAVFFRTHGLRKPLLLIFALYLPIDWLLRLSDSLAALASIWDEGFLLLCILVLLGERMASRDTVPARPTALDVPLLFFIALSIALCLTVSPNTRIAVDGLRAVIQYMLWFFVVTRLARELTDWLWFVVPLCVLAALVSLYGVYQFIIGVPIPAAWVSQSEMGVRTRVFSIFGSPNVMGSFLVMTAPLCAAFAYLLKSWAGKIIAWGVTGLLCVACLLTFSRGAWLGMAVAIVIFSLLVDRRLLMIALGAAGIAVFIPQVSGRITFLFTGDFAVRTQTGGRAERWATGFALLRSTNQLFGYGLGRFGGAVAMQNQVIERIKYFYMDNYYLKTLVEMGYAGLTGYLFLLVSTLVSGLRNLLSHPKSKERVLLAALLSGMAGVLLHCYYENIFEVPYMTAYFWAMAGMLVTIKPSKTAPKS